jgi:hypothetical protein
VRGGKRPGAGRKKGSTKLLPDQKFDLFSFIEEHRAGWPEWWPLLWSDAREFRRAPHQLRSVRLVCGRMARDLRIRWVDEETGKTVTYCNLSGLALANIYHSTRKQFFNPERFYSPGWYDEIEWGFGDPLDQVKWFNGNPPAPKRKARMVVTVRNSIKNQT